jgi:hypothetical protein
MRERPARSADELRAVAEDSKVKRAAQSARQPSAAATG